MDGESGFQVAVDAPARYEECLAPIMAPFVEALVDGAVRGTGRAVLDVACGTGFVARRAAARVGRNGRVVGVDVNPGMLAMARSVAVAAADGDTAPVEWLEASAEAIPPPDASFDAVVCQQGLQFVPDPDAAVAEMARLARPGGSVAATVWSSLGRSPYFGAQLAGLESILGPTGGEPFVAAFDSAPALVAAFARAGLTNIDEREIVAPVRLEPVSDFVADHFRALPWADQIREARPDGIEAAARTTVELLEPLVAGDSVTAPFASVLVSARR